MARMITLTEGSKVIFVNADLIRAIKPDGFSDSIVQFDNDHSISVKESPKDVIALIGKLG